MAIEIISFPHGYELNPKGEAIEQIDRVIEKYDGNSTTLREGEYDITPQNCLDDVRSLNLLVLANGTGSYRVIPKDWSISAIKTLKDKNSTTPRGEITAIPQSSIIVVVMEYYQETGRKSIHKIISYKPGRSPK